MEIDRIKNILDQRESSPLGVKSKFAVLLPLYYEEAEDKWYIIYERRAMSLRKQPGEISFPGGQLEKNESFQEAAVRETMEELDLAQDHIEVLGELDYIVSSENLIVKCFLGQIKDIDFKDIRPSQDEVDHIFKVPLDFFIKTDPLVYSLPMKIELVDDFPYYLIPNGKEYDFAKGKHEIIFYQYEDYTIWGFTAKMTWGFIEIVKEYWEEVCKR